nr:XRE family transcriptional regulator [uncultured Olsenella sp.]
MSVFGDNVARLRAKHGLSQRALAAKLDITNGAVASWESKDTLPDYERIKQIAQLFDVPVPTLFARYIPTRDEEEFSSEELRVYGKIAAGTPFEMEEGDYGFPCPTFLTKRHPKAFFLEVYGESMNRVLPNGSLALVDPTLREPVLDGSVYAVCVNGYDATVKRVRRLENGLELDPDSTDPTFHPMVYDATVEGTETITIIGRVIWYTIPFEWEF